MKEADDLREQILTAWRLRARINLDVLRRLATKGGRLPLWLAALLGAVAAPAAAQTLSARFLGNEAFEISDGETTLLTDFPYRSGAFGYMDYDAGELRARTQSLCLITHAHADHFEAGLAARIGCRVLGPPSVLAKIPKEAALTAEGSVRYRGLTITPVPTDHGGEPHFSYLVEWKWLRLYFTGDTESTAELGRQGPLDALFISPWLLASARGAKALPPAARVIVYHHRAGEKVPSCSSCLVPRQGETVRIAGTG